MAPTKKTTSKKTQTATPVAETKKEKKGGLVSRVLNAAALVAAAVLAFVALQVLSTIIMSSMNTLVLLLAVSGISPLPALAAGSLLVLLVVALSIKK